MCSLNTILLSSSKVLLNNIAIDLRMNVHHITARYTIFRIIRVIFWHGRFYALCRFENEAENYIATCTTAALIVFFFLLLFIFLFFNNNWNAHQTVVNNAAAAAQVPDYLYNINIIPVRRRANRWNAVRQRSFLRISSESFKINFKSFRM